MAVTRELVRELEELSPSNGAPFNSNRTQR